MIRSVVLTVALSLLALTAQASLVGRSPLTPGGSDYRAYYDAELDITWLADADYAQTSGYASGGVSWYSARSFIDHLNEVQYLGASNWRLPATSPVDGVGYKYQYAYDGSTDLGWNVGAAGSTYSGSQGSELAHLFFTTLGNSAEYAVTGENLRCDEPPASPNYCLTNSGPFTNIYTGLGQGYWSNSQYEPSPNMAWHFYLQLGRQDAFSKTELGRAWAVTDGDAFAATVPIPPAVWLFGSALGLMGVIRRKISS